MKITIELDVPTEKLGDLYFALVGAGATGLGNKVLDAASAAAGAAVEPHPLSPRASTSKTKAAPVAAASPAVERSTTPPRQAVVAPTNQVGAGSPPGPAIHPVAAAPAVMSNEQPYVPAAEVVGAVHPDLVASSSFRQVIVWMKANGFTAADAIVAECERIRPAVPTIQRLGGDLKDRVARALVVLGTN
jgi:hypothetical protein